MSDGFINDDFEMGAVVSGTFKELVEAKTGITISTDPTETEASIYLREGVTEVTNRMLVLDPESAHQLVSLENLEQKEIIELVDMLLLN